MIFRRPRMDSSKVEARAYENTDDEGDRGTGVMVAERSSATSRFVNYSN